MANVRSQVAVPFTVVALALLALAACEPGAAPDPTDLDADGVADDAGAGDDDGDDGPPLSSAAGGAETCSAGDVRACFDFPTGQADVGACVAGSQSCIEQRGSEFATGTWGPCEGAVGPESEACGDGIDGDCDGEDPPCDATAAGAGGSDSGSSSGAGGSATGAGGGPGCAPSAEICGNGVDEDCDGADGPCEEIDVELFLLGDCITASCPDTHPYPVACDVLFSPGDDRGCIASQPDDPVVYFQAGDECSEGIIGGTLTCSNGLGDPLDAGSCPINKPIPIYATDPSGCPEITD